MDAFRRGFLSWCSARVSKLIPQFIISRLVRHAPSFHHSRTRAHVLRQYVVIALGNRRGAGAAQLQKASHDSVA